MTTTSPFGPVDESLAVPPAVCPQMACTTAAGPSSVQRMRRFVLNCVRRLGLSESTGDTACLIVSELVTNAVLHSGSCSVAVLVGLAPEHLLISVRDGGSWLERPEPRRSIADDDVPCGRGLDLVRAIADRCTIVSGASGTAVEARVRLDSTSSVPTETLR
ncbi:ATP-binding protein [Streptomyces sp. NPDC008122]|uniref:ATP-binding protein n=1 Tax=Streptomyces sp. NPDC008122 TaxID=3364810 RepID=UPI0036DFCA4D